MKFVWLPESIGTLLDPPWSELELYLSGDEFLRCDLKECTGYSLKDKKQSQNDKTKHENRKSVMKSQSQKVKLGDDVERLWNELARLGTSMKVLEVKELCKLLVSEGGESLRCLDAKLTLEMGQKERNGVAGLIGHK
ncbi:hypothetical protein Tco_0629092 [Tanacetum coccineum]|uniref:Uncharacterized protein n=1 Tax=Tanacetum coccineum TaxID=301880 RepID=A0ABQ4WS57_9ASTR